MVDLDNQDIYQRVDPSSMRLRISELPLQCERAWQQASSLALPPEYASIDKVVVAGMGGSAIGGDLLRCVLQDRTQASITVHRDYGLPPFVDERTLFIAASYSGMTEETLDAFSQALGRPGCKIIAVTSGGTLKSMAEAKGIPVFTITYQSPPRAALGYSFVPLLAVVDLLRISPPIDQEVKEAIEVLECMRGKLNEDVPLPDNLAKGLALKLEHRLPLIYAAGPLTAAAYRWKTQMNENAKAWAFSEYLPELHHNSVTGYTWPRELAEMARVVLLYSTFLHRRHMARYTVTRELLDRAGISHVTVEAEGDSLLAQVLSLIYMGDWTSYYLAILTQTDPTSIPAIDFLKNRLKFI